MTTTIQLILFFILYRITLRNQAGLTFSPDLQEYSTTERARSAMPKVPRITGVGDIASGSNDINSATVNDATAASTGITRFHRSNSERIRDGAKAFLRHVESFKSKHRKKSNREENVSDTPAPEQVGIEQKVLFNIEVILMH